MLNKRGPNIDPCGTPNKISFQELKLEKVFLEISQNSQENTCARVSLLINKETLAQVFFLQNSFFYSTPSVAASGEIQVKC